VNADTGDHPHAMKDSRRSTTLAASAFVLVLSLVPMVVVRELLGGTVSQGQRAAASLVIVLAGFLRSVAWAPMPALRPLFVLFGVLTAAQWIVLAHPSERSCPAAGPGGPLRPGVAVRC